ALTTATYVDFRLRFDFSTILLFLRAGLLAMHVFIFLQF
ncbi:MAG: hypothetical protein ACI901_002018, partial [Octadecabacter sp.]